MSPPQERRNPFVLQIECRPDRITLLLSGEFDVWDGTNIDTMLAENPPLPEIKTWADLASSTEQLVVDMTELTFIDSSGINWLLRLRHARGTDLPKIKVCASWQVRRVIDILRIAYLFDWP